MEDDCVYCQHHHRFCGEKMTKHEFMHRGHNGDSAMSSKQASYFLDFWLKSMKIHQPGVSDLDHLDAFRKCLDQKREEVQSRGTKRASPAVVEDDFDDDDTRIENNGEDSVGNCTPDGPLTQASEIEMMAEPPHQSFIVTGTIISELGACDYYHGGSEMNAAQAVGPWYPDLW